jgi:hypothetical protein
MNTDNTRMESVPDEFAEIDSCNSLLLRDIGEPSENSLRVLLEETFVMSEETTILVAGVEIAGGHPVKAVEGSRLFEIIWNSYVAYSILNELYVSRDDSERFFGRFARIYTKSHFIDYVSCATFACSNQPGPLRRISYHRCYFDRSSCHKAASIAATTPVRPS